MRKDVAVIGGSAAGLFTAYLLARKGHHVRIFEAANSVDPPPRTLIVTSHMRSLLGSSCESAVINKIRRFELFANGRVAEISLARPDLIIERSKLIKELATKAQTAGAHILTSSLFQGLKPNGKRLTFTISRNGDKIEESSEIIVGADGALSRVAQSVGLKKQTTVPLLQAIVELPKDMSQDTSKVWFVPEDTPYFYWLIPHSPTQGVLGLIGAKQSGAKRCLESFLQRKHIEPVEFQSACIPRYTGWIPNRWMIGKNQVYLVGDAAGHVKVTTVGGIVTGFRGALGVAEAILNGGPNGELSALRRELGCHRLIRRVLHGFTQNDYVKLFDMLRPLTTRSLSLYSRDDSLRLLLKVIMSQPRFILLGLRSLLNGRPLSY